MCDMSRNARLGLHLFAATVLAAIATAAISAATVLAGSGGGPFPR
jgi:hypothetical protein